MDHWQPEQNNPRGNLTFGGGVTSIPGYAGVGGWNGYATFLLGQMSSYGKSVQFEVMSGRENQYGLYIADRWEVNEKFTLNLGLRYEYYPLMARADRGLELLNYDTFNIQLGGLGGNPKDLGIEVSKTLFAPRVGAAYRLNEDTVFRAGYGRTFNPLPWSRPFRGFYPLAIGYSDAGPNGFIPYGTIDAGLPPAPSPDLASGNIPLPRERRRCGPPIPTTWSGAPRSRGTCSSNAACRWTSPRASATSARGRTTATPTWNGTTRTPAATSIGCSSLRPATPTSCDWGRRLRSRYHSLQVAVNRPFKHGLLLKGSYTWSKALNEADDDGWVGLTWNQPSQLHRNYALAGYDRPHMFRLGFVYELPFARESSKPLAHGGQELAGERHRLVVVGPAVHGGRRQRPAAAGRRLPVRQRDRRRRSRGFGAAGPDAPWYDPSLFSQPGNAWGNSGRNAFRGPSNWNLDFSVFRAFPIGRYRAEFRAESQNVFNHAQWGNPVTGHHRPELHADPDARASSAHDSTRSAFPVLAASIDGHGRTLVASPESLIAHPRIEDPAIQGFRDSADSVIQDHD